MKSSIAGGQTAVASNAPVTSSPEDAEVDRLKTLVGDAAAVHILDKREIENYLAVPRALAEFIGMKRVAAGQPAGDLSVDEVTRTLSEVADRLKADVISRRLARSFCKPLYPSREALLSATEDTSVEDQLRAEVSRLQDEVRTRAEQTMVVAEEERRVIQEHWESRKLSLAPGDELLDGVCRVYGVRFRKERDAQRLAAMLREDEVAPSLRSLLHGIVKA